MATRGVVWDCDGTKTDSTKSSGERFLSVARNRGLPITAKVLAEISIVPRRGRAAINYFWPAEDADTFYREWEAADISYPFVPIPGTREALEDLRRMHIISTVLSNRGTATLKPMLEKLGTLHLVNFFWGCGGYIYKPKAESARPILDFYERLNIRPQELLFVGDNAEDDWPVARDNGAVFLGVLTGISSEREFLAAGVPAKNIVCSIAEVPEWIRQNDR